MLPILHLVAILMIVCNLLEYNTMRFSRHILRRLVPSILLVSIFLSGCNIIYNPVVTSSSYNAHETVTTTGTTESTVSEPPITEPPVTEPPVTEPPASQPEVNKIPFLDHQQVFLNVTVMVSQLKVRSGPGMEYDQVALISYGRYLRITELHGTLDNLWGCYYGRWICLDYTDFYVNSTIYQNYIASMDVFSNSINQALPLTIVHKLVTDHFNSALPDNKTVKKALVIGYDGFRTDGLDTVKGLPDSAVMRIKQQGGLYHTFTGGISGCNEQLTISAPSWVAAASGGWADYNGVCDNGIPKNNVSTFMTTLAEQGKTAAMIVSWPDDVQGAFQPDIDYAAQHNLPIQYVRSDSDATTFANVLSLLQGALLNTPDVVFCVFNKPIQLDIPEDMATKMKLILMPVNHSTEPVSPC